MKLIREYKRASGARRDHMFVCCPIRTDMPMISAQSPQQRAWSLNTDRTRFLNSEIPRSMTVRRDSYSVGRGNHIATHRSLYLATRAAHHSAKKEKRKKMLRERVRSCILTILTVRFRRKRQSHPPVHVQLF